jgi:alkylhydroperoxidase family enzyme
MFKKWYLSRMQTEIDQRGAQIAEAKTRAAAASEALRAEHQKLIAAAEGKGRDLHLRLEELRTSGKDRYAELKALVEIAREGFGEAVRTARRFA